MGVVKCLVVEGGEGGAEGQVAEGASAAGGLQVEGVSQPQVDDL